MATASAASPCNADIRTAPENRLRLPKRYRVSCRTQDSPQNLVKTCWVPARVSFTSLFTVSISMSKTSKSPKLSALHLSLIAFLASKARNGPVFG